VPVRVILDQAACTGHGRCYTLAPEVFDADDQGHCVVREAVVSSELAPQARVGAANCPERAIEVVEED
jgi:ferredoxin